MRWSEPGNIASTTVFPKGVSAHHGALACTSKKNAPESRTARNTSDKASMKLSQDDRASTPDARSFETGSCAVTLSHETNRNQQVFSTEMTMMKAFCAVTAMTMA